MIELKEKYNLPSEYADFIGLTYAISTSDKHKKDNGQFFTPKHISDFMANLAKPNSDKISILDPGCGTAILSCSLIEKLVSDSEIRKIDLTLYETDKNVLTQTKLVAEYLAKWLKSQKIEFNYTINELDFVLDNSEAFNSNSLFGTENLKQFDYIISNPPYFKISKADKRASVAKELVYGQPNIYSIFMGLSAKLLKSHGELIFITPRSFAAGNYFKAFRQSFFREVSISDIHIFESRNKMFKNDNVLQENIILRATKFKNASIKVTVSECDKGLLNPIEYLYSTEALIDLKSKDKVLFIPSNQNESDTIKIFRKWNNTLNDFNIQISTGPVVAFRCTDFLKNEGQVNGAIAPLVWLHNVKEMEFAYPLQKGNKPSLIENNENSRKVLLKNKNYIFLRRFSSKDDKSRLVCCPYFSKSIATEMVGVENHINYIHRPNGVLSETEIWGISALYSSSLFDTFFRTFNGNTQVGASELKQIKMPPLEDIEVIGNKVKQSQSHNKQEIDKIINEVLLERIYVKNTRSSSNFERVGGA
ncbi:MAG: N-6 DNA methylase [Salinivirgaceae bacterium]|jgi:adenine-specific DNA-methyltransferase|nr:N-6 DNA methylase [Salinivirgaceae bacterium]